jgi:MFS family permease
MTPLRESRSFRRLWAAQAVASVGWRSTAAAVPFQVYELAHWPLAVGLPALTQFVPLATFTLVGGTLADVLGRRRLLVASSVGFLVSFGGLVPNARHSAA